MYVPRPRLFFHCLPTSDLCCTRAYSPKLQERSFQQMGQAMRFSKWTFRLWVSPRVWSSDYFTIPTTTSPFATCTASDHEWVSNVLNGYFNVSDEWIVHDEAGLPSLGLPESGSNCSALIKHDHEFIAPPEVLFKDLQFILRGCIKEGLMRATWSACSALASQPLSLSSLKRRRHHSPVYISLQVLCRVAGCKEGAQEIDVLDKGAVEQGNETRRQEGKFLEEVPVFLFNQKEVFILASRMSALHLSITSEQRQDEETGLTSLILDTDNDDLSTKLEAYAKRMMLPMTIFEANLPVGRDF
ncbi:hypothetical protein BPAE_0060g00280 [Botrytis paeoniae]|uniref:Uncharacterized protein n=1 Tax=Botrytis paeoniae TaxID=278948 RepID=A0A4Z1FTW6_9HELO|nr:hypothetical protein BPAE_0060g00280 [Botrytis paeoniae]